ncbi:MAG: Hsp70 family protein [SAR324 cluster bacterium]|nr:Hsp70 family protein [SAR324 cluster bacterium]
MGDELKKVYGIDLGTTYSCISHVDEHGKAVIIQNSENERITPSVVFFEDDNVIVGQVAKENATLYPEDVVSFIKRAMGDPNFYFEKNDKTYSPEEISSYVLRKLVGDASEILGEKIEDVVITCPAYFGINEREATKLAGEIAGLNVRQILNEPTAAAVTYGLADTDQEKVTLVYDLGGGTFDITMIDIKPDAIQVICTGGDHNLGGKDWDDAIVRYISSQFQEQTGSREDILDDPETYQDVQISAEKSKKTLSTRGKAPISVTHGGERAKVELTQEKFNELTGDLLERTINLTHDMLKEAEKKGYKSFDEILLVGGSTRMPQVKVRVEQEFKDIPVKVFDPDEAVAKGAALYAWKLSINDELIKRIADSTGKEATEIEDLTKEDFEKDKMLASVAQEVADDTGFTLAAIKSTAIQIKNVTSKSFGVVILNEKKEEKVFNLVMKNSDIPIEVSQEFYTVEANQARVDLIVKENELSKETLDPDIAVEIGKAVLNLPAGLPEGSPIEVIFNLNKEGRLLMTGIEKTKSQKVEASIDTTSVISGKELEEAKQRNQDTEVT